METATQTDVPQSPENEMDAAIDALAGSMFGGAEEAQAPSETPAEVGDEADAPEEDAQAAPAAGDTIEIETDTGEKVTVPAKLKDAFLRQQDYTRKTQELAELRRQAAIAAQQSQMVEQFQKSIADEQTELSRIEADIARYKALDWTALDTDTYLKAKHQMDTLRERAGEIRGLVAQKAEQFKTQVQQQVAEAARSGEAYLKQKIPTWGPDAKAAARAQAMSEGYTDDEMANVYDPRFVSMAWKAAQYERLMAGKTQALSKTANAPPVVKPGQSDPAMSAKMQGLNWAKQMKNARTETERRALAEQRMAKLFGG